MDQQDQLKLVIVKVVESDEEPMKGDGLEANRTSPMDADQDSIETPPVKEQTSDSEESQALFLTPSEERSLEEQCLRSNIVIRLIRVDEKLVTIESDEEEKKNDGLEADRTSPMDEDQNSIETPPMKDQVRAEQTPDSEESQALFLTPSEEWSLKEQCLQSNVVVRLVQVDKEFY